MERDERQRNGWRDKRERIRGGGKEREEKVDAEKGETKGQKRTGGRIPSRSLSRREKPI
jgi:hypothetical protein